MHSIKLVNKSLPVELITSKTVRKTTFCRRIINTFDILPKKAVFEVLVCPLCNGLTPVRKKCPVCQGEMIDAGLLQDYYDNYSAYLEQDIYRDGYRSSDQAHCVHLFACPRCHFDTTLVVDKK